MIHRSWRNHFFIHALTIPNTGNPSGSVTLIKLSNVNGIVTSNVLKSSSHLFERIWGNFGGMLSLGAGAGRTGVGSGSGSSGSGSGPGDAAAESAVSLAIHPIQNDVYVLALCRDHKVITLSKSVLVENRCERS